MKSFIIFLACVASTQSSSSELPSTVYGLTEEKTSEFYNITNNQGTTLSSVYDALNPIFDVLEILYATRKYNLQGESFNYSTLIAKGLETLKIAGDRGFDSIPVILGTPCPVAEDDKLAARQDFHNFYTAVEDAIGLAVSGNFTDVKTEFEPFSNAARTSLTTFMPRIFNSIRECTNTTDVDVLAAIKDREDHCIQNMITSSDAIFDAIKVFASGISTDDSAAPGIVPSIQEYRQRSTSSMGDSVANGYSSMRGLFIGTKLNKPKAVFNLTTNQYAYIVADTTYQAAGEVMYNVIKDYLNKIRLGLSGGCDGGGSSALDEAEIKTAEYFKAGLRALIASVPIKDSTISAAVQSIAKFFESFAPHGTSLYYKGIRFARDQGSTYNETVAKIQAVHATLRDDLRVMVRNMFRVMQLGRGNPVDVANFENGTVTGVHEFASNIFTEIDVLAKACHGVKVLTEDDFIALQTTGKRVLSAARSFNWNVTSGHVSVIKTLHDIITVVPTTRPPTNPLNINLGLGLGLSTGLNLG